MVSLFITKLKILQKWVYNSLKSYIDYMDEMARATGETVDSKQRDGSKEWDKALMENDKFIKLISKVRPSMLLYTQLLFIKILSNFIV